MPSFSTLVKRFILFIAVTAITGLVIVTAQEETPEPIGIPENPDIYDVEILVPEVIAVYPHDPDSYTQGLLLYEDGVFYESDGGSAPYGRQSSLRRVDLETGEVLQQVDINEDIFAEGLALVDDRLIQLTWRAQAAVVFDRETFEPIEIFEYFGEGWGLCYDGVALYMSNGSANITVRDPQTFDPIRTFEVTVFDVPVEDLNELECVDGHVYANVWRTDTIVRIDMQTGIVDGVIDGSVLLSDEERASRLSNESDAVLNGIAYNPETGNFYLTGKLWPDLFEVRLVPRDEISDLDE